jgi:hypothetical protein
MALSALVLAGAPRGAFAQTAADTDRAERLFAEASALVAAGKYAEACPRFEESERLDGALGTHYNLALCFEKIGKLGGVSPVALRRPIARVLPFRGAAECRPASDAT